jgi:putative membrane protein
MPESTTNRTTAILWLLAAAYAAALVGNIVFGLSIPIAVVLSISVAFALIHGAVRYGWRGIVTFIVICLVVSNIFENVSILTGFPFGHYHYTDVLGLKLFLVPVLDRAGLLRDRLSRLGRRERARRGAPPWIQQVHDHRGSVHRRLRHGHVGPHARPPASTIQQQWIWE